MKLRLMKIIYFFPCLIIDGITLTLILLPMYVICGTKVIEKEPLIEWLTNLNEKNL